MVTPCVCTPGSLGAMPVCIMLSSRRISASISLICNPLRSTGTPESSLMPKIRSPPAAFANDDTSARNSFLSPSELPGRAFLYSMVFPSGT